MGRSRRQIGAGLQRRRTAEAPKRRSTRSPKLSTKAAAQQAATGTSQDDAIKAYSSGSDIETEENDEEEEESSSDEAPSPMEEDEEEWSGDEALAPPEDQEDEMDEDESDGDEGWVAPKPKTRRAPAKKKKRKHARKGSEPAVAAERRRATEAMLEELDIDGLSDIIDDGTLATIELKPGVTLECSVSQALLDALWSKCEELKAQIEVLVHKYERRLDGEKIIVSLPIGATLARWIMEAARPTKLIGRFPHRNFDVAQHHPGDGLTNEDHKCVAKVLTGFWDMLADQGFITLDGAEKLKSCVKVFDQHPLAQITRKGRVEIDFDDEAERLCGGAKGVADLLALHHARLELMLKIWHLAHDKPLAVVAWGEYAREHVEILAAAGLVEYLGHVMHPASYWRLMMDVKKRLKEGKSVPCNLKKDKHFDGGAALCPEITRSLETEPKINLIGRN